jgi:hypothetical protein
MNPRKLQYLDTISSSEYESGECMGSVVAEC